MVDSWLSRIEIDCLSAVIGKRIHRIFTAMLTVYEADIRMLSPAIVPLFADDSSQRGFLIIESGEILTQIEDKSVAIQSRPTFRMSSTEPVMPVIHQGNKSIFSGSDIYLEGNSSITKIEVFQFNSEASVQLDETTRIVPVACDAQITFYRGELSPVSFAADGESLYFMRDMGLVRDTALDLRRRLVLP